MSGTSLDELYREIILENAADPCGHGAAIDATHRAEGSNPLCGDVVDLHLRVEGETVTAAAFHGESCAICTAAASLLCRQAPGRAVAELPASSHLLHGRYVEWAETQALQRGFERALGGDDTAACPDFLEPMLGVRRYPARIACALLPWETAGRALREGAG